jgi:hypothetical protein
MVKVGREKDREFKLPGILEKNVRQSLEFSIHVDDYLNISKLVIYPSSK